MKSLFATLLVVLALPPVARAADQWSHAKIMTVVMIDDQFQPDHVTFQQGKAYELRLENRGKEMHEFTAPDFFRSATVRDRRLLANGGIEVVVQPGHSARGLLIPRVKGDYGLTCADHDWNGMVGGIKVD
ncbi:cupredoxin domain-containing protein [Rhodopila sp.]|uniref:cupredoxin domain-containing protein n=1 Tax=Rhodopila sp. TaxID=2480087 RepID=UPI003D0E3B3A